jgi:GNAT superfamily N-acetyltransferase
MLGMTAIQGLSHDERQRIREITKLQTDPEKRRKGHAQWLMCEVCVEADQHGMVLMLTPEPFGDEPLDADQLMLFYRRFGFREIPNPGGPTIMVREPR